MRDSNAETLDVVCAWCTSEAAGIYRKAGLAAERQGSHITCSGVAASKHGSESLNAALKVDKVQKNLVSGLACTVQMSF